jgi:DNA replication protein DnaC
MSDISQVLQTLPVPEVIAEEPRRPIQPMQTEYPAALLSEKARIEREHRRYRILVAETTLRSACPNCNGVNWILLQEIVGGPFLQPPMGRKSTYIEDGWYTMENHYFDCPVCTDPAARRLLVLRNSGLEACEQTWTVDYIQGKEGKTDAFLIGREILGKIPRPTGWYIFYGDFGRGKSGLMKSIVAQSAQVGVSARYTHAAAILDQIRSTFSKDAQLTSEDMRELYGSYQVLAIDEIEKIPDTGWATSTLMLVLEARYNRRTVQATLIGTNEDPEAMPVGFGYLQSRMKDGERVRIAGIDLRGQR